MERRTLVLRSKRRLLGVLAPVALLAAAAWGGSALVELGRRVFVGDESIEQAVEVKFSDLLDYSGRRAILPVLPEVIRYGPENEDFGPGAALRFAGILDGKLLVVGDTWMAEIDTEAKETGPIIDFGSASNASNVLGRVGRILYGSVRAGSELWVQGQREFVRVDRMQPWRFTEALDLGNGVMPPVTWFGDVIVTSSSADFLRFHRMRSVSGESRGRLLEQHTIVQEVGDPLFPIIHSGLPPFFNLLSLAAHPEGKWLAVAFRFSDRIEIYDRHGSLVRAVAGPVEIKLDFDIVPRVPGVGGYTLGINDETRFAYLAATAGRQRFVTLFAGTNRHSAGSSDIFSGDEVHAYCWDGRLGGIWRLPERVVGLYLDEARQHLYGIQETPYWSVIQYDAASLYEGAPHEC